jgi:hypothetical protein
MRCYAEICLKKLRKKTRNLSQDVPKDIRNGYLWNTSQRYLCLRKDNPPNIPHFKITQFRNLCFKKVRKWEITFLKGEPNFPSRDGKRIEMMVTEILLDDNITLGQSCCVPSTSSVLEFGFRLDSIAYSYTVEPYV